MVLIAIRAPIVSLCITIISVICELAFLTAALSFMRYRVCSRLQKQQKVTVRSQHNQVLAVTLFAMLAFVAIEAITSIFSDPQTILLTESHPCARNILGETKGQAPNESEAIHFACTRLNGTNVSHFEGNYSYITLNITCADDPVYSYEIGKQVELSTDGAAVSCEAAACSFARLDGNVLYVTGPQRREDKEAVFSPTTVSPDRVRTLNLTFITEAIVSAFPSCELEEGEIRRKALMGSTEVKCPFSRDDGPGTTIPLGVIIGAAVVWTSSLLFFFLSLFFRRKIFFDITHPMHWARRVRHDVYRATGTEPELELEDIDGEKKIIITGYASIKDE